MKVSELIKFLKKQPQDIDVAYVCYSENTMLEAEDIKVVQLSVDREDGWIPNSRPDKAQKPYLLFPGF